MRYRNTKTGAVIDSSCIISGGDWIELDELVEEVEETIEEIESSAKETPAPKEEIEETPEPEEEIDGIEDITINEIKQELDAFGIKYNAKARKQDLYNLMLKGR